MEAKAIYRNVRMSPRKLRVYRELVKGLSVREAEAQLRFLSGDGPVALLQTLRSAVANARHNFDLSLESLSVSDVIIDAGFTLKRWHPANKGRAHAILKRTAHVTVIVEDMAQDKDALKKTRGRRTKIKDLTTDDLLRGKVATGEPGEKIIDKEEVPVTESGPHHSKQEEAYQKVKMQQLGGDLKKSHRRKTVSGK